MVVFKVDMEGDESFSNKIINSAKQFQGARLIHCNIATNELYVKGRVDLSGLSKNLKQVFHKKFELIHVQGRFYPYPWEAQEGAMNLQQKKREYKVPGSTVLYKVPLHCEKCVHIISKIISKYEGVYKFEINVPEDVVMIKGIMDVKALQPLLKQKLRRNVIVIPPKKKEEEGSGWFRSDDGQKVVVVEREKTSIPLLKKEDPSIPLMKKTNKKKCSTLKQMLGYKKHLCMSLTHCEAIVDSII